MNVKKMYFFKYRRTSNLSIIVILLRIIGCLIIGQRFLAITKDEDHIGFYMERD